MSGSDTPDARSGDAAGDGTSDAAGPTDPVPEFDDEYLDRVAGRLAYNYDLERDRSVRGRTFPAYGELVVESSKHFLHPALSIARHEFREHLFVERRETVGVADLERLVGLGRELADEWIEADPEHYSTDFTFVVVAPEVPDAVAEFVADFRERTLLRGGFHGHYEINLAVVAPDRRELVASREADVGEAFRTWEPIERETPGLLGLIARRLQL